MVERLRPFQNFQVLSVEDFILTKLARDDRGSTDMKDVIQLIIQNQDEMDWKYFKYRLEWANVKQNLLELMERVKEIHHIKRNIEDVE